MSRDPVAVWAEQTIKVWPENYYLIDVGDDGLRLALKALEISKSRYACIIRDQTGFSLVIDENTLGAVFGQAVVRQKYGPLKVISTDSPLPFDVVGFIQAALRDINGAGYKAAPQCGLAADHFFTGAADIDAVENLFRQLIDKAKAI